MLLSGRDARLSDLVREPGALLRAQRRVVAHAVALGCRPVSPEHALTAIRELAGEPVTPPVPRVS